jgi:uncharacterized membrane protein
MMDLEPMPLTERARELALTTVAVVAAVVLVLLLPFAAVMYSRYQYRTCIEEVHSLRYCIAEHPWGFALSPGETPK